MVPLQSKTYIYPYTEKIFLNSGYYEWICPFLSFPRSTNTTYIQTIAWDFHCFLLLSIQATREERTKFFLFGVLCGLALYNQSIVYLPFPLALFKKLLGVQATLEDMKDLSSVGKWVFFLLLIPIYGFTLCFWNVTIDCKYCSVSK